MGQTSQNIDQTAGDWAWRQSPGLRSPNSIPNDAPTQSTLAPVPPLAVAFNKGAPAPLTISTTKNPDGSTASAQGRVPNSSVIFSTLDSRTKGQKNGRSRKRPLRSSVVRFP